MISVKNLTKTYRSTIKTGNPFIDFFARKYEEKTAVENISFEIGENELVGFVGPNGAGKTTTMKILAGILFPSMGTVSVLGLNPFNKEKEYLKHIAFIMGQKNQLLWDLPATDSFLLNKEIYEVDDATYKKNVSDLLDLLDCHGFVKQPVKTLSLGQRMRVELIAALLHAPKVLYLDEPTIGLDIFGQAIIVKFLKEYQEKFRPTIILTSHYMKDIQQLAKRILLIDHGRIIHDGSFASLVSSYSHQKEVRVILEKPIDVHIMADHHIPYEYKFPLLTISLTKDTLMTELSWIMSNLAFIDVTIEDEPIEEVIKKVFAKH